jgi:methyl-accepting chemotaxis protein
VSLVIEVLIILILTEFAYHKIEKYKEINKKVIESVEKSLLKVEVLLEQNKKRKAAKFWRRELTNYPKFSLPKWLMIHNNPFYHFKIGKWSSSFTN